VFGRNPNPDQKSAEMPKPFVAPVAASQPSGPAVAPAPTPFAAASVMTASVIGTDLTIMGDRIVIISKHQLQVDGDVRGDVNGKSVVIGPEGSVVGTVSAEAIEVRGGVRGAIRARSVTLHATAQVDGDILHQTLAIAEGARFDGRVRRAKDAAELNVVLDPAAYESAPPPATQG
jgi:cytoskeletal protein CcmA (bactofilin family)